MDIIQDDWLSDWIDFNKITNRHLAEENFNRFFPYFQGAALLLEGRSEFRELISQTQSALNKLFDFKIVIAVFAPFNYGKSTFLNAWLGQEILPMGIVATTGTVIKIKYGPELMTRVQFSSGKEIFEKGTEILQNVAVLDSGNKLRKDIKSIEVFCAHPFLKLGLELVDLPGTNSGFDDSTNQDEFIKQHLLEADIIIQLVNAHKVFSDYEIKTLQAWLLDRGINSVLFVINFMNQIKKKEEQNKIWERAKNLVQCFDSQLLPGVNNLYRVDALPALEARVYQESLNSTGLQEWESAILNLIRFFPRQVTINGFSVYRLKRVQKFACKMRQILQNDRQKITEMFMEPITAFMASQFINREFGLNAISQEDQQKVLLIINHLEKIDKTVEGLQYIEDLSTETFAGKVAEDYYLKNMFKSKD
jgi:Dynamin family